jgi:hypothetical protein
MGPDGARNQERLCWRGPAAIYWTGLDWITSPGHTKQRVYEDEEAWEHLDCAVDIFRP